MNDNNVKLPLYSKEIYGWLYNSFKWSRFFDSPKLLGFLTLGNYKKLTNAAVKEVRPGLKVLQTGVCFGNMIEKMAEQIGFDGKYEIMDVNRLQLEMCEEKYKYLYSNLKFIHQDATKPIKNKYDVIVCYMLMHEMPIQSKVRLVENLLDSLNDRGKAVFIDYHNPVKLHPLRYFVRMFNRLYQPFAEKMWDREIHSFALKKTDFIWRKTTYFGRMYQKVVAQKKDKLKK